MYVCVCHTSQEEREAAMRAEEDAFRAKMLAKFAEDDRLEQLNAQKRRMKQVEHQREVQRLIDERRRMYEEQKARDEAEIAQQQAEEVRLNFKFKSISPMSTDPVHSVLSACSGARPGCMDSLCVNMRI